MQKFTAFSKNIITHDIRARTSQYNVHEVLSQTGQHNPHIQNLRQGLCRKENLTAKHVIALLCPQVMTNESVCRKFAINSLASVSQRHKPRHVPFIKLLQKGITQRTTIDRFTKLKCNVHHTPTDR